MKGLLFNVVQDVVEQRYGPDVWDDVVRRAGVDGAFTSLGSYDGVEFERIVGAIANVRGITLDEAFVLLGRHGFAELSAHHSHLIDHGRGWRDILASLDDEIHVDVLRVFRDAQVPRFRVLAGADGDGPLLIHYRSKRELCRLAEGLILGLGEAEGVVLKVDHHTCVRRDEGSCLLVVSD